MATVFLAGISAQAAAPLLARSSGKNTLKVAQVNGLSNTNSSVMTAKNPSKNWSLPLNLESSSSLHKEDAYERNASTSLEVTPSYNITKRIKASANIAVFQDQTGEQKSGFTNTLISLSYKTELRPNLSWTNGLRGTLPTDRELQDTTSYQGALRASTGLKRTELIWGSSVGYVLNFTRNFHEYNLSASGSANVAQTIGNSVNATLPFAKDFSLNTNFGYTYGWTYAEDTRTKFVFGADISWDFAKDWSSYVGTSNEGNALKPNGTDSNIQFYDDNSSVIKIGISYTL